MVDQSYWIKEKIKLNGPQINFKGMFWFIDLGRHSNSQKI